MKMKTWLASFIVVCLIVGSAALPFKAAWAGPIKLKAVSFIPVQAAMIQMLGEYAKRVKAQSKGELVIEWVGGPEVIPTPALAEAVIKGRVDMMIHAASGLLSVAPEVYCMQLSEYTPVEERKNGVYDFYQKYFNKAGLQYLGRGTYNIPTYFFTNFPVKSVKDLAGHRIGAISFTMNVIKNVGATPINIPKREWFTSVERKVVDGYTLPAVNVPTYGLSEVTKYAIDHPFQNTTELFIAMNLKKYNSLPKHLQKVLNDVFVEMEPYVMKYFGIGSAKAVQKMKDAGMEFVKLSPEDAKQYLETINNTWWDEYKGSVSPEVYSEAKKLILK